MRDSVGMRREVRLNIEGSEGMEEFQVDKLLRALHGAYEAGRRAKATEIRSALNINGL